MKQLGHDAHPLHAVFAAMIVVAEACVLWLDGAGIHEASEYYLAPHGPWNGTVEGCIVLDTRWRGLSMDNGALWVLFLRPPSGLAWLCHGATLAWLVAAQVLLPSGRLAYRLALTALGVLASATLLLQARDWLG